jgi:hydroxyacylglutathione hydrolase
MILESFPVGPIASNCTILGDEQTHEAIVIDPGAEVGRIHRRLIELGLTLKQILITHAHLDHIGGAVRLKQLTDAPVYLNENDIKLLGMADSQAAWMGIPVPETALPDEGLDNGQVVGLERYPATVLFTPGHTQGSVCLYFAPEKLLIAGDTLFAGSIGRTDLPGGNYEQIINSLHTQVLTLPDETRVITGHGPETVIGDERRSNPFLRPRQ